ncbi:MAG: 50S ribosomal protein L17 [Clostridia bacterium]|nr:50S ribosomal protein L17 [Clostridia bacterium]
MPNRKLGKPTDQRVAMLRNLTTALLWNGRIITTEARAKDVRPIAEKIITLAVAEYKNSTTGKKEIKNDKDQIVEVETYVDLPSKLHARRQIMSYLYDIPIPKGRKESKTEYRKRIKGIGHPVVERLFREIAPAMDGRTGGYTRIMKLGPRRGDAAEMAIIELVNYTLPEKKK